MYSNIFFFFLRSFKILLKGIEFYTLSIGPCQRRITVENNPNKMWTRICCRRPETFGTHCTRTWKLKKKRKKRKNPLHVSITLPQRTWLSSNGLLFLTGPDAYRTHVRRRNASEFHFGQYAAKKKERKNDDPPCVHRILPGTFWRAFLPRRFDSWIPVGAPAKLRFTLSLA